MAHKPSEEFLIPAELILESPEGITVGEPSYPEAKEEKFDWSEITLRVYKGKKQEFTLSFDVLIHYEKNDF